MNFRFRLILSISLLIALTFGLGGAVLISFSFQSALEEDQAAALESYEAVRNTLHLLNSMGGQTEYKSINTALSQMEQQNIAHWQAISLHAGEETIYQSGNQASLSVELPTPAAGQYAYIVAPDAYGHGLHILSTLFAGGQELQLLARFDISAAYRSRDTQLRLYWMIYLAVVLLGFAIASALAFVLTRRLRRLTAAVRQLSGGDLTQRSDIQSDDEFGQLARDFNAMADRLQSSFEKLETEVQRQEAFMGAVAHELKTPMTSIIGYADLLRQSSLSEADRLLAAEYIFSEGQRLEKLSFKLLDLLLLKNDAPPHMVSVNLEAFLSNIEGALQPLMEKRGVRLTCRAEPGRAYLEPDLVKSLLYNLADNASKAMDHGGSVAIRASVLPGGCMIQVADNGRGMEASELSKITEPFYRVDKSRSRQQGGAGLGLALCSQIVQVHNGNIHFQSIPGKGTCVTVELYGQKRRRKRHEDP